MMARPGANGLRPAEVWDLPHLPGFVGAKPARREADGWAREDHSCSEGRLEGGNRPPGVQGSVEDRGAWHLGESLPELPRFCSVPAGDGGEDGEATLPLHTHPVL